MWGTRTINHLFWPYIKIKVLHFTCLSLQDLCALFMVILYFSKYSSLKLGKDSDQPEYNGVTWFMMLFTCGIGVGLFFYGVAEPIFHYTGHNRYTSDPTIPDNTLAQISINLTLYHWGKFTSIMLIKRITLIIISLIE